MSLVITNIAAAFAIIAIAAILVLGPGCGHSKDNGPEALCKMVYDERVDGPIRLFTEQGPKHKQPFLAYCVTLPTDYLECEAADITKMKDGCMDLLKKHQRALNDMLINGEL